MGKKIHKWKRTKIERMNGWKNGWTKIYKEKMVGFMSDQNLMIKE